MRAFGYGLMVLSFLIIVYTILCVPFIVEARDQRDCRLARLPSYGELECNTYARR